MGGYNNFPDYNVGQHVTYHLIRHGGRYEAFDLALCYHKPKLNDQAPPATVHLNFHRGRVIKVSKDVGRGSIQVQNCEQFLPFTWGQSVEFWEGGVAEDYEPKVGDFVEFELLFRPYVDQ